MKIFIIIILSISIIRSMKPIITAIEENDGNAFIGQFLFMIATILALIFACNLN